MGRLWTQAHIFVALKVGHFPVSKVGTGFAVAHLTQFYFKLFVLLVNMFLRVEPIASLIICLSFYLSFIFCWGCTGD